MLEYIPRLVQVLLGLLVQWTFFGIVSIFLWEKLATKPKSGNKCDKRCQVCLDLPRLQGYGFLDLKEYRENCHKMEQNQYSQEIASFYKYIREMEGNVVENLNLFSQRYLMLSKKDFRYLYFTINRDENKEKWLNMINSENYHAMMLESNATLKVIESIIGSDFFPMSNLGSCFSIKNDKISLNLMNFDKKEILRKPETLDEYCFLICYLKDNKLENNNKKLSYFAFTFPEKKKDIYEECKCNTTGLYIFYTTPSGHLKFKHNPFFIEMGRVLEQKTVQCKRKDGGLEFQFLYIAYQYVKYYLNDDNLSEIEYLENGTSKNGNLSVFGNKLKVRVLLKHRTDNKFVNKIKNLGYNVKERSIFRKTTYLITR